MTCGKGVDDLNNTLIKKKGVFNYAQDIVMAFSPPVVCCLVKKGLQKGGHRHPWTPPGCAYEPQQMKDNLGRRRGC